MPEQIKSAKVLIEVQAGIVPGTPMPEYTKRWAITSEQWAGETAQAREDIVRIYGESREYAATLEDPRKLNWVRRDWLFL